MEEKKANKEELKKEFLKTLKELEKDKDVEKMIKDNRIHFRVGEVDYKVRKPNYAEQMRIEDFRRKKYSELIDDDSMMFRKQWVEKYLKKGIDIDKMEKDVVRIQSEIDNMLLRLAETENKNDVEKLVAEIVKLKDEQAGINIDRTDFLSYSIEDQLQLVVTSYYAYSVLEKLDKKEVKEDNVVINENKWVKAFKSYDEFVNCKDSKLINKTFYYVQYIVYTLPF